VSRFLHSDTWNLIWWSLLLISVITFYYYLIPQPKNYHSNYLTEWVAIADKAALTYDSDVFTYTGLTGRTSALSPWAATSASYTAGARCCEQHFHTDVEQPLATRLYQQWVWRMVFPSTEIVSTCSPAQFSIYCPKWVKVTQGGFLASPITFSSPLCWSFWDNTVDSPESNASITLFSPVRAKKENRRGSYPEQSMPRIRGLQ